MFGHIVIQVNQPQYIQLYNRYMDGVYHHDQLHIKYECWPFPTQVWKYVLWYFVTTGIVNAYILYCKTSTRQTKMKYAHLDFQLEITMELVTGFSSRMGKAETPVYIRSMVVTS